MIQAQAEGAAGISFPKYGDIYEVQLDDPPFGSETGYRRPGLIVSNDSNNELSDTVTVLPITGQPAKKVFRFEVLLPRGTGGLTLDSRVKANQIRTVDKARLTRYIGTLPSQYLPQVEEALKIHLKLT